MDMKRIIYTLSAAVMLSAAGSCTYDITLDGLDKEGKLYLICVPGGSDTTVFSLKATYPVSGDRRVTADVKTADVRLSSGGRTVQLLRSDGTLPGIAEGMYYTLEKFQSGETLEMEASVNGVPPVSARTSVPASFPRYDVRIEPVQLSGKDSGVKKGISFRVTFDDREESRYYGMQVMARLPSTDETDGYYEYYKSPFYMDENTVFSNLAPMLTISYTGASRLGPSSDSPMVLWDGNAATDVRKELVLDFLDSDSVLEGDMEKSEFKVIMYRLSPEFYRFAKASFVTDNNPLVNMGLSAPSFTYTNVSGGTGVFGAVSMSETEWIEYSVKAEGPAGADGKDM